MTADSLLVETPFDGVYDQFVPVVGLQLVKSVLDVVLHGVWDRSPLW
jgi:hypothetical protein